MKLLKVRLILVGTLLLSPIVSLVAYSPQEVVVLRQEIKKQKNKPESLQIPKRLNYKNEFLVSRSRKTKVKMLKQYTKYVAMTQFRYTEKQFHKVVAIWTQESQWNWKAKNPHSRAYGIPQVQWSEPILDPFVQIVKGLEYIENRYGNADNAYAFKMKNGWY